jgi:hypothetical protein
MAPALAESWAEAAMGTTWSMRCSWSCAISRRWASRQS